VGTVLAQIEQGLQVFNATAKRFFRSAKEEYELLFEKTGRYGTDKTAQDYAMVLDDPDANFAADFQADDIDIRPVSDPSAVTRMQKMAKAQYLQSLIGMIASAGGDVSEVLRRSLEAGDIEDIDKIIPANKQPNPMEIAQLNKIVAATNKDQATADRANAEAVLVALHGQHVKYNLEHEVMSDGMKAANL
jgi:hypothetical protein